MKLTDSHGAAKIEDPPRTLEIAEPRFAITSDAVERQVGGIMNHGAAMSRDPPQVAAVQTKIHLRQLTLDNHGPRQCGPKFGFITR